MSHRYPLRSRGGVPSNRTHTETKRAKTNPSSGLQITSRYRGSCRYTLGYRGPPGSGAGALEQEDRTICNAPGVQDLSDQILEHGYVGSKGGRGSRVHSPNSFCEYVRREELDFAAGDRVVAVFSRTFGCRKLRVLEVTPRGKGGFIVRFTRPHERGSCFKSGYGSFSLAIIRAPGSKEDDFVFEQASDADAQEHDDYVQIEDEEEEDEEDEEDEE